MFYADWNVLISLSKLHNIIKHSVNADARNPLITSYSIKILS